MIFNAASRAEVKAAEPLWLAKFILRWITFTLSILTVGLTGYATAFSPVWAAWLLIPSVTGFLWNGANILVRFLRPRPMHPGANVGVDLCIWLAYVGTLWLSYSASITGMAAADYVSSYHYSYYDQFGTVESSQVLLGASVFGSVSAIFHFVLFVWACVDTNKRNSTHLDDRAAMIAKRMVLEMRAKGELGPANNQMPVYIQQAEPLLTSQKALSPGAQTSGAQAPYNDAEHGADVGMRGVEYGNNGVISPDYDTDFPQRR